ncbi:MAG: NADase-type glycan-binding domain-containing protein [Anaerolineales bacterium]
MSNKHLIIVFALLFGMLLISGCEQTGVEELETPTATKTENVTPTPTPEPTEPAVTPTEEFTPTSPPEDEEPTATPTESPSPTSAPEETEDVEGATEDVEGWVGTVINLPAGNQFGQYFEREDGEEFDIGAVSDDLWQRIREAKQSGVQIKIWGTLYRGVPGDEARHIEIERIEMLSDPSEPFSEEEGEPVEGWTGTIYKLPPGNQFGQHLVRDDGERFGIGATDDAVREKMNDAMWTGAQVKVWGTLYHGVPAAEARQIQVERLEVVSEPAPEPRYLSPFARASASSHLPSDRYGQYFAHAAVDESLDTAWAEGASGPGIGEWIEITFPGQFELYAIDLANGYQRSDDLFAKNNRVKQATLIFSDGEQMTVDLADERGRQHIDLIETRGTTVETDTIRVIIDEVYPGTAYDDTCLAEIEIYGVTK